MDEHNSLSMPDINPLQSDENNQEDYAETCDEEVNNIVTILERLHINDNGLKDLQSGFSLDSNASSIKKFEQASLTDSNIAVPSIFVGDVSYPICLNEDTKAAVSNQKSISRTEETQQLHSTITEIESHNPDVIQKTSEGRDIPMNTLNAKEYKILSTVKETKGTGFEIACIEEPLHLDLDHDSDHNIEASCSFAASDHKPLIDPSEKIEYIDPETGEMTENSNIIPQDTSEKNSLEKLLVQYAHGLINNVSDSSELLYIVGASCDVQSIGSSNILLESPPHSLENGTKRASLDKTKRSRKTAVFDSPDPDMSEVRKCRFGTFQPPSNAIVDSRTNSSDEENSRNSSTIGKQIPRKSRKKCRRPVELSPRQRAVNSSIVEERRSSPCKRKKTSSKNMTEATGKFRKRSISKHNSETGENTHLVIRSKSLSPDLKKIRSISGKNPPSKSLKTSLSRKRTNSFSDVTRVKLPKPSTSSDDAENIKTSKTRK